MGAGRELWGVVGIGGGGGVAGLGGGGWVGSRREENSRLAWGSACGGLQQK
jgi:hypothetical protein